MLVAVVIEEKSRVVADVSREETVERDELAVDSSRLDAFMSASVAVVLVELAASVIVVFSPVAEIWIIVNVIVVRLMFSSVNFATNNCLITTISDKSEICCWFTVETAFCRRMRMAPEGAHVTSACSILTMMSITSSVMTPEESADVRSAMSFQTFTQ